MQTAERVRLAQPVFDEDEIDAVVAVLRSGNLVSGERVAEFERMVAQYLGVRDAVANSNGTAALHLALLALDVGPGDEVIVPDFTFPSTANMVEALGATSVVVDIDLATFNLDPDQVAAKISGRTKAILPVHLFGMVADLRPLVALSRATGVPLIEDAACALGATYPGEGDGAEGGAAKRVGTETAMACLSFHPRKVITTAEGGMVVTDDDRLARRLRQLRNHGTTPLNGRMIFNQIGFNYRMTELQGALGVTQMQRLEALIEKRRTIAALYDHLLAPLPVSTPYVPSGFGHVYQSYVLLLPESIERDHVIAQLKEQGVESTIGTYALHAQPYYRERYGWTPGDFPHSWIAYQRGLALPIHPQMTEAQVRHVVSALARVLEGLRP